MRKGLYVPPGNRQGVCPSFKLKKGIPYTIHFGYRINFYTKTIPLTKRELKILINESVRKALKYYFDKEKFPDPEDFLFKTQTGQRLDRIRAWTLIKKWVKAVGLDPSSYGTHTLRKTWGYHSRKNFGIPIELISEKLGHSSNAVTKRYIGISQEEINNIEKKVCL